MAKMNTSVYGDMTIFSHFSIAAIKIWSDSLYKANALEFIHLLISKATEGAAVCTLSLTMV